MRVRISALGALSFAVLLASCRPSPILNTRDLYELYLDRTIETSRPGQDDYTYEYHAPSGRAYLKTPEGQVFGGQYKIRGGEICYLYDHEKVAGNTWKDAHCWTVWRYSNKNPYGYHRSVESTKDDTVVFIHDRQYGDVLGLVQQYVQYTK